MSNGQELERLWKLQTQVNKLIMDGKRDPMKVADALQAILVESKKSPKGINKFSRFFQTRPGLFVSDDFRDIVLSKALASSYIPRVKFTVIIDQMYDKDIEGVIGTSYLFTESEVCNVIMNLIKKQAHGETGRLSNRGYANIFYLHSCVVRVRWDHTYKAWVVNTRERNQDLWSKHTQVFSRR